MNERTKKYANVNIVDNTKRLEASQSHITDNLMPEESLVDTTTTNTSNINLRNTINQNPTIEEPSNAVLLAGLQDLSVNNLYEFGSTTPEN